jgi:hypothetical protein
LAAAGVEISLRPPELTLAAGAHHRLRVVAESRGPAGRRDAIFTATAEPPGGRVISRASRAVLVIPESP